MNNTFLKLPEEKRLFILKSAAIIFAREGYHQASVADICNTAGISNGALYKYFNNKDDLFDAVMDYGIDLVSSLYRQFDTTGPVIPTLEKIFSGIRIIAREMGFVVSIYLDLGTCALNRFAERKSDDLEKIGRDFLTQLLSNAAARGEIDKSVDITSAVFSIDNLIILYSYSTVSTHHHKRLLTFMREKKDVSEKKKIAFLIKTISGILNIPVK